MRHHQQTRIVTHELNDVMGRLLEHDNFIHICLPLLSYDLNDTIIVETCRTLVYIHVLDSGATMH